MFPVEFKYPQDFQLGEDGDDFKLCSDIFIGRHNVSHELQFKHPGDYFAQAVKSWISKFYRRHKNNALWGNNLSFQSLGFKFVNHEESKRVKTSFQISFQCSFCLALFTSHRDLFTIHLMQHYGPVNCTICEVRIKILSPASREMWLN